MAHWTSYNTEAELRTALVANAQQYGYAATRYRHQGRTREHGVDCLGLLLANAWDFGFDFRLQEDGEGQNDHNYSIDPDGYYLAERLQEEMIELPSWRDAIAGDIVLMRWHVSRPPQHVGIITSVAPENLICVHASRKARRVVETRWDREDLITHGFRIKELANFALEVAS